MISIKISGDRTIKPGDIIILKVRDIVMKAPGRWEWQVDRLDLLAVKAELEEEARK